MTEIDQIFENTLARFRRVVNKVHRIDKTPKDLGTGEQLFIAEIHTIVMVTEFPRLNVTELAEKLGVTKGAVSQVVGKLEKKGYLKRVKDVSNDRVVRVIPTKKGKTVVKSRHEKFFKPFLDHMGSMSFGQVAVFNEVLEKIEGFVDKRINEL